MSRLMQARASAPLTMPLIFIKADRKAAARLPRPVAERRRSVFRRRAGRPHENNNPTPLALWG